jgi:GNAT superfamily N-acetyltransferase
MENMLHLDSIRTVREYDTAHSRIWLEIYEDNPKVCVFTHLLVAEDHRQKGYGTKALEQAEIIAKDLGCENIHIKVETDSWMHNWYLRSGYQLLTHAEDNYVWLTKSIYLVW